MSQRSIQYITKEASINKIQKKLSDGPILWNFELFWEASIIKTAQKMMDGFIRDTICWQMNCLRSTFAGVYASRQLKAGDAAQPKGCSACFVPAMAIKKPVFLAVIENNRDFTLSRKQAFRRPICTQKPDDFRHPAFQLAESEGLRSNFALFLPPFICSLYCQ